MSEIFRREALEHYQGTRDRQGGLLLVSPRWLRASYWLVVGSSVVGALLAIFCSVNEYGVGPAIIRGRGRTGVTARTSGLVSTIEVVPGQKVSIGQVLVRLDAVTELNELARTTQEYELQLMKMLQNPGDRAAGEALTAISAQKQLAEGNLEQRTLRAPADGTVSDLRIRPAQLLNPGDTVLILTRDDAGFQVLAAVPGEYRPMVRSGAPLRMELDGFPYSYQDLQVESADTAVVGPNEVRRFLGQELSDAVKLEGPVFLVQAALPTSTFTVDHHTYRYYDGMQGRVHARARKTRVLLLMFPWLRILQDDDV